MNPKGNLRLVICATDGEDYRRVIIQISLGRFLYTRSSCKKPQRALFVFKSASHSGFVDISSRYIVPFIRLEGVQADSRICDATDATYRGVTFGS